MTSVSQKLAKNVIASTRYMTIATVNSKGEPWSTPVARFYDDQYNFYWASDQNSVHSSNIKLNGQVFISIYNPTTPSSDAWGVYLQAKASEINDEDEANRIAKLFNDDPYLPTDGRQYLGTYPRRIYKAVPKKIWMNDEGEVEGNYIDIRTKVKLV